MAGKLYVVGTPIGNLGDMTDRARRTLASVDLVAAEDTRRTGKLLAHFGITARTVSLFEGNDAARSAELLDALRDGKDVAIVSDAGMPVVADPGHRIVAACIEDGIEVRVIPGPSAAIAALVVSGLPSDRFSFEGFPPRRKGERLARLKALAGDSRTLVFFESPKRAGATLREIVETLGDRRVALVRELTKMHEEVIRGRASEVAESITEGLKGEVALVVQGAEEPEPDMDAASEEAEALVGRGMKKRPAAAQAARRHRVPANDVYRRLIGRGP
ncbi:MAG: 16S rRNA (cytidine(1402)-2'-O)-methyltransferase [Actinomycetota bacterium]